MVANGISNKWKRKLCLSWTDLKWELRHLGNEEICQYLRFGYLGQRRESYQRVYAPGIVGWQIEIPFKLIIS